MCGVMASNKRILLSKKSYNESYAPASSEFAPSNMMRDRFKFISSIHESAKHCGTASKTGDGWEHGLPARYFAHQRCRFLMATYQSYDCLGLLDIL